MFRLAIIIQWIGLFSLFGLNFIMPLFLQRVHGMGAAAAGRVLLPMGIVSFITLNVAGRLYHKLGPRPIVMTGLGVVALTTLGWSRVTANTSTPVLMLLVSARGLGLGLFGQNVQLTAYNTIPEGEMPRATALVNVGQRVAGAFSTAMLTSVLVLSLHALGAPPGSSIANGTAPLPLMVKSFHNAFLLMTAMSVGGILLATRLRDRVLEEHKARLAGTAHEVRTPEPAAAGAMRDEMAAE